MVEWRLIPCPNCQKPIELAAPAIEQKVVCPSCEELWVVVSLEPPELSSLLTVNKKAGSDKYA